MNQPPSEPWPMTPLAERVLDALRRVRCDDGIVLSTFAFGTIDAPADAVKLELLRLNNHGYVTIMPHDAECSVFNFWLVAKSM